MKKLVFFLFQLFIIVWPCLRMAWQRLEEGKVLLGMLISLEFFLCLFIFVISTWKIKSNIVSTILLRHVILFQIKSVLIAQIDCQQFNRDNLWINTVLRWNLNNLSRGLNPPKSAKTRFKFSADLNLETFYTILSGTNHI